MRIRFRSLSIGFFALTLTISCGGGRLSEHAAIQNHVNNLVDNTTAEKEMMTNHEGHQNLMDQSDRGIVKQLKKSTPSVEFADAIEDFIALDAVAELFKDAEGGAGADRRTYDLTGEFCSTALTLIGFDTKNIDSDNKNACDALEANGNVQIHIVDDPSGGKRAEVEHQGQTAAIWTISDNAFDITIDFDVFGAIFRELEAESAKTNIPHDDVVFSKMEGKVRLLHRVADESKPTVDCGENDGKTWTMCVRVYIEKDVDIELTVSSTPFKLRANAAKNTPQAIYINKNGLLAEMGIALQRALYEFPKTNTDKSDSGQPTLVVVPEIHGNLVFDYQSADRASVAGKGISLMGPIRIDMVDPMSVSLSLLGTSPLAFSIIGSSDKITSSGTPLKTRIKMGGNPMSNHSQCHMIEDVTFVFSDNWNFEIPATANIGEDDDGSGTDNATDFCTATDQTLYDNMLDGCKTVACSPGVTVIMKSGKIEISDRYQFPPSAQASRSFVVDEGGCIECPVATDSFDDAPK